MNVRSISNHLGGNGLRKNRDKWALSKHCFVGLGPLCIMGRIRDYNTVTHSDRRAIMGHLINFYLQTNVASNTERKVMFTNALKQLLLSFCFFFLATVGLWRVVNRWVSYFFASYNLWQRTPLQSSGPNLNAKDTEKHSPVYANVSDNGCPKFVAKSLKVNMCLVPHVFWLTRFMKR